MCLNPKRMLALVASTLAVLLAWPIPAQSAPFPRLELIAGNGSVTNTRLLPIANGKWLFVYVRAQHAPSDELLKRMSKARGVPERTVIVLGGVTADRLASFTAKYPQLATALWFVDPVRKTGTALKLGGTPIILGIDNQEITWTLNGLPASERWTESMFTTWVKQRGGQ